MKKRPFLIFSIIMSVLLTGLILTIQSRQFAHLFKEVAARHLPSDLGIEGDFSEFAIKIFPPGISVMNPKLAVKKKNIVNMPEGSSVEAERIDLIFLPFQMFSGSIRVNEVVVVNGTVRLVLPKQLAAPVPRKKRDFQWDQLLQVHAEAIALRNTKLHVELAEPAFSASFLANSLRVAQWAGKGGPGYDVAVDVAELSGKFPATWKIPASPLSVEAQARLSASGLSISALKVAAAGVTADVSGNIAGNLLSPKDLNADLGIRVKAELPALLALAIPKKTNRPDAEGQFAFTGKLTGNLEQFLETLKVEGELKMTRAHFQSWHVDQLRAAGSWLASPEGGELAISQGMIESAAKPRTGANQPGSGGKIEIGAFRIPLGRDNPFTVPLRLERAHLHWLAAPAIKDIYALDMRVSGNVLAAYRPASAGQSWSVRTQNTLSVEPFQLDNQRFGVSRPLHRVLEVAKIRLDGELLVNDTGVFPQGMIVALPKSQLKVGGKVDFKSGYDLQASGNIDLADVGHIAEIPIRGEGGLNVRVHGPAARTIVDFDADLKNAYYLRLRLGDLKGRITWDDDPQDLLFTNIKLVQGRTPYTGEGKIQLGDKESVDLSFHIADGNIHDFGGIFDELTSDIWWYPRSLTGAFGGDVRVSGGLNMQELKVLAQIKGTAWEYLGERLKTVSAVGGYDRGTYYIGDFKALKRTGSVLGRVSYDAERKIDWALRTEDFTALDLDHFAQLDVPLRGNLAINSAGVGFPGAIEADTRITLSDFSLRGTSLPPSFLRLKSEAGIVQLTGRALGEQGILEMNLDPRPANRSFVRLELNRLDFSPLLLLINPSLAQERSFSTSLSGLLDISFRSGDAARGTGKLELTEFHLSKSNTRFQLSDPVSVKISDGSFDIPSISVRGNQGEAFLTLQGRNAAIEGVISGALDVSIIEFVTSSVAHATGLADLDFALSGTLDGPLIFGRANLEGVTVRVAALETPFENVTGALQLRQNTITVQDLTGDLAGGRVAAEGAIQLFADRFPSINLKGSLSGNKIKVFPFQFAKVRGSVNVRGDELPYLVDGSIIVDQALSKEKLFTQRQGSGLKATQYMPPPTSQSEGRYPKFKLNIDVRADRGIIIQNELFDAEVKGQVTLVNTLETPRVLGSAQLVQGRMIFKNRVFQIQSASGVFDNPTVINPSFDLMATTEINNTKIQLYAAGRMDNWKPELTANPSLPESEILSLLALGLAPSDVKRMSVGDRSVVEQGEAASLILHSLDFNREVQTKTGFQIQLGESVDSQTGTSVSRPLSQSETAAAPKIVIKRQIGKNIEVSAGSTVGVGTNNRKEVNAEFRVTPGFSVQGVFDSYESADLQEKKSYGLDLKFQKRFK